MTDNTNDSNNANENDNQDDVSIEAKETLSTEYVDQLKKEVTKWRLRAKENKEAAKKFADAENRLKEAETKAELAIRQISEVKTSSEKRIIDAELKALAQEFGLKKYEYIKLGNINDVKLDDNGNVIGAREMMEKLKNNDPDLFKLPTTTNTDFHNGYNDKKAVVERPVLKMNKKDYDAAERDFLNSLR